MDKNIWDERRRALEDGYFAQRDHEILEHLKSDRQLDVVRHDLTCMTGISDPYLLDQMVKLGMTPSKVGALPLIPLIAIAWANGNIEVEERDAVLAAAKARGLRESDPAYDLIIEWLAAPPHPFLMELWTQYIAHLRVALSAEEMTALRADVIGNARTIAKSSGGLFGLGDRVSSRESRQLEALERVLDDDH